MRANLHFPPAVLYATQTKGMKNVASSFETVFHRLVPSFQVPPCFATKSSASTLNIEILYFHFISPAPHIFERIQTDVSTTVVYRRYQLLSCCVKRKRLGCINAYLKPVMQQVSHGEITTDRFTNDMRNSQLRIIIFTYVIT